MTPPCAGFLPQCISVLCRSDLFIKTIRFVLLNSNPFCIVLPHSRENDMQTFEPGKTYKTRSVCDHDCIISLSVAKRTAKTITTDAGKVLRVFTAYGAEHVMPRGRYSMAPVVSAEDVAA